jgi:hypothetical protein
MVTVEPDMVTPISDGNADETVYGEKPPEIVAVFAEPTLSVFANIINVGAVARAVTVAVIVTTPQLYICPDDNGTFDTVAE